MGVFISPVLLNTAHDFAKDMAGQMPYAHPRQNQEPCIISHKVDIFLAYLRVPSDKGVARSSFPRSGAKEKAGNIPTGSIPNEELQIFPYSAVKSEVMITVQIVSHTAVFI